jgi:hypothetical protein
LLCRDLTPPSSGRLTAGCASGKPPLMSNVGPQAGHGRGMPRAARRVGCRVRGVRPAQRLTSAVRQCPPGSRRWRRSAGRMRRSASDSGRGGLPRSQVHAFSLQMLGCQESAWLAECAQVQEGECALSKGGAVNLSLAPNPSFERTAYSGLRPLPTAAQLERWAPAKAR